MHIPIIIAGTREQFCDWCAVHHTHPAAAQFVESASEFREAFARTQDVRLWGSFNRNPAYLAYLRERVAAAA